MWSVKDIKMERLKYLETWGDPKGYVLIFSIPGGVGLWGKVEKGEMGFFVESIKKKYPMILNVVIDDVKEKDEIEKMKELIEEIHKRNENNIIKERRFPK